MMKIDGKICSDEKNTFLKKISLLRILSEFNPVRGGSSRYIIEESIRSNPYFKNQVIIAPIGGPIDRKLDDTFPIHVIRIKYRQFGSILGIPLTPISDFLYMVGLYKVVKKVNYKYKFDVICAHGIVPTAWGVVIGKLLHIPVVAIILGSLEAYTKFAGLYETGLGKYFKPYHGFIGDDGPLTTGKFSKLWGPRTTIFNLGIDMSEYKPMPSNKSLLKELKIENADFIILSTSSLHPIKRIDLALIIFKKFLDIFSGNKAYMIVVGEGPLREDLLILSKKLNITDRVIFTGSVPATIVRDFLSIADVLIGTSLYSNMNYSIQEAMACGIPVVAFNSGGTDRIINNFENGLLINCADLDDFARKLELLYNDPLLRRQLGLKARETIYQKGDWSTIIQRELKIYEEAVQKNKGSYIYK